jgi:hypothetical protein
VFDEKGSKIEEYFATEQLLAAAYFQAIAKDQYENPLPLFLF